MARKAASSRHDLHLPQRLSRSNLVADVPPDGGRGRVQPGRNAANEVRERDLEWNAPAGEQFAGEFLVLVPEFSITQSMPANAADSSRVANHVASRWRSSFQPARDGSWSTNASNSRQTVRPMSWGDAAMSGIT